MWRRTLNRSIVRWPTRRPFATATPHNVGSGARTETHTTGAETYVTVPKSWHPIQQPKRLSAPLFWGMTAVAVDDRDPFLGREAECERFEAFVQEIVNNKEPDITDRSLCPIGIVQAPSGGGKSRFLDEISKQFCHNNPDRRAVLVTFNGSSLLPMNDPLLPDHAAISFAWRLVAAAAGVEYTTELAYQIRQASSQGIPLTIEKALEWIITNTQCKELLVVVDEFSKLAFFDEVAALRVMSSLGTAAQAAKVPVVAVAALLTPYGVVRGATEYGRPFFPINLPPLTPTTSQQLWDRFFVAFPHCNQAELLFDVTVLGTHPRNILRIMKKWQRISGRILKAYDYSAYWSCLPDATLESISDETVLSIMRAEELPDHTKEELVRCGFCYTATNDTLWSERDINRLKLSPVPFIQWAGQCKTDLQMHIIALLKNAKIIFCRPGVYSNSGHKEYETVIHQLIQIRSMIYNGDTVKVDKFFGVPVPSNHEEVCVVVKPPEESCVAQMPALDAVKANHLYVSTNEDEEEEGMESLHCFATPEGKEFLVTYQVKHGEHPNSVGDVAVFEIPQDPNRVDKQHGTVTTSSTTVTHQKVKEQVQHYLNNNVLVVFFIAGKDERQYAPLRDYAAVLTRDNISNLVPALSFVPTFWADLLETFKSGNRDQQGQE
eukprot:TRINITY_DN67613_c9_g1_i1.p1 TRINITY_DN67613_c9_g1~~TRINITY_DN67613_c9_g1_i1.p1  ORF type:complete len:671 (+),score=59.17 TRINITY_DN67613_c9_g1_i1:28-2013(+)